MNVFKNFIIPGRDGKPMSADILFHQDGKPKPLVVYAHGFNGFKDWGNFNLIAEQFVQQGLVFVKFNFSLNGTTVDHPDEFVDLEGYAQNNYTRQLDEIGLVIDWCVDEGHHYAAEINKEQVYLLGHSLGGGLAILKAAEDRRIKKLVTWAAINECKTPWTSWSDNKIEEWKNTGRAFVTNSRTNQQMPLDIQLYKDYQENKERLNIEQSIKSLSIPILLCHGSNDTSVPVDKAEILHKWQPQAELFLVESDHVFGRKHPWFETELPEAMQAVLDKTRDFLQVNFRD